MHARHSAVLGFFPFSVLHISPRFWNRFSFAVIGLRDHTGDLNDSWLPEILVSRTAKVSFSLCVIKWWNGTPSAGEYLCQFHSTLANICSCLYHKHAVDRCASYGQRGHDTIEKTVLVGTTCPAHSTTEQHYSSSNATFSDSGYWSGKHH